MPDYNTDDLPEALRELAKNAPPTGPEEQRVAIITYLAALGEALAIASKTPEGHLVQEILEQMQARIERSVPLDPKPGEAHQVHVLIFHQLVIEGYESLKSRARNSLLDED